MRRPLLKQQPILRPRRAQGTGQKSATPATLTKVILVLLTMFLLPNAAWGQTVTVTKTIYFNQSSDALSNELPVHIKEEIKGTTYIKEYDSKVTMDIDDQGIIKDFSYTGNDGAVFELTNYASTEGNGIGIIIPGKYPQVPETVKLKVAYNNSYYDPDLDDDGISAIIHVCDFPLDNDNRDLRYIKSYPDPDNPEPISESDYLTTPLTFNGGAETGHPGTDRNENRDQSELYIWVYLDGNDYEDEEFNQFYDRGPTSFTIKEVEITYEVEDYGISVTGIPVTAINADDILGDGTVFFTPANATTDTPATLELKGNEELTSIFTSLSNLTINLQGTNKITAGSSSNGICSSANDGTLTFSAASGGSLEISNPVTYPVSVIRGFKTISGLDLETKVPYEIYQGGEDNYYRLKDQTATEGDTTAIDWVKISEAQTYSLWVGGVQVTNQNNNGITGVTYTASMTSFQSISGSVSFNPTGNILTLVGASIGSTSSRVQTPIISNLPNLTININGTCYLAGYQNGYIYNEGGGVMSLNTNAELVFTTNYTSSSNADSPTMQISISGSYPIASGFKSISTDKQLIYIQTSNYYSVRRIAQPTISLVDGNLQLSDNNEIDLTYNDAATLKYKITDATDQSSTPIEETYDSQATVNIENPCTIDAWAEYQDQESDLATAKYFGFVEELNVEYDGNESEITLPDVVPAIASSDGVTLTISTSNSPIINKNDNDKWVVAGLGKATLDVSITGPTQNAPYQILNEKLTLTVKSAPAPPTIGLDEGTYFAGTVVTITPTVEGVTTKYQWDNESEPTVLNTSSPNMPTIPTGTHTLTAWSEYSYTDVTEVTLKGSEVEATYTAGNYDLIIAGNEVDATMTVTGEGIEGTVSYNKDNHTLTLNKAKINGTIESNIEELTVYLIGENTITVNSDNLPFMYKGSGSPTLTFDSSNSDEGGLTMTSEDIASGYEVENSFEEEDNYYSNLWTYNSSTGETYIYYNVQYGIIVGDYNVSKENMNNITNSSSSEVLTYSPDDNILNLPLALSDASIISHREELTIQVSGTTALKSISFVKDADFYDGTGTLTIVGDSDYDGVNSLSLGNNSSGVITGFSSVDLTLPMHVSSPENFTGWTASVTSATITDETWDLSWRFENGQSYATYCDPSADIYLPSTITPSVITEISGSTVKTQALSYIPKGVPVLLSKTNNTATTATFSKNLLKYVESSENPVTASESKVLYVLYNDQFVKVTPGSEIYYGGYLDLTGVSLPANTRGLSIDGIDGTSAIDATIFEELNTEGDAWYDLQGRKLQSKPTKAGLYIFNGKKIVLK